LARVFAQVTRPAVTLKSDQPAQKCGVQVQMLLTVVGLLACSGNPSIGLDCEQELHIG
jgi:hypothetical protein